MPDLTHDQHLALRDRLLAKYRPLFPKGLSLEGQVIQGRQLAFQVESRPVVPGPTYAVGYTISTIAIDDGQDAEHGLLYLLDRARRGNLPMPERPEHMKTHVLLSCTTEHGWQEFTPPDR